MNTYNARLEHFRSCVVLLQLSTVFSLAEFFYIRHKSMDLTHLRLFSGWTSTDSVLVLLHAFLCSCLILLAISFLISLMNYIGANEPITVAIQGSSTTSNRFSEMNAPAELPETELKKRFRSLVKIRHKLRISRRVAPLWFRVASYVAILFWGISCFFTNVTELVFQVLSLASFVLVLTKSRLPENNLEEFLKWLNTFIVYDHDRLHSLKEAVLSDPRRRWEYIESWLQNEMDDALSQLANIEFGEKFSPSSPHQQ